MLDAMDDLGADIRRLNIYQVIEGWTVNLNDGGLRVICGCDHRLHGVGHYNDIIRAMRGPVRKAR